jgi:hypothetical protein
LQWSNTGRIICGKCNACSKHFTKPQSVK